MQNCNVLGIDVAKKSLVIFNQSNNQTIAIPNEKSALVESLEAYSWKPSENIIALESTGDYSFLPMQFFTEKGFTVKLINPIVTKKLIKATIRSKKTDKSDAQIIAEIAFYGEGQIITENDLNTAKKTLLRLENKITKIKSDFKRIKKSLEIKDKNGIELTEAINQVDQLIAASETAAEKIWQLSRKEKSDRQEEIISSHPGCGEKLSAIISEEAGNIKRFPTAKQFKAYAGIDPKVYQSGEKDVHGKMTKRGNPFLRQALFLAAFVASIHDPELKEYYQKKRAEGKPHILSVCAVSRKLCERIYSTVTQDKFYERRYPQG